MDQRIDLTENRDFRDSNEDSFDEITRQIQRELNRFNIIDSQEDLNPNNNYDQQYCARCGKKIISTMEICEACNSELERDYGATYNLFRKENIRSVL